MQHKYRGKRLDGGGRVVGSLVNNLFTKAVDNSPICYIIDHNKLEYDCWEDVAEQIEDFQVDPATVGQATGLSALEDKPTYQHDLLKANDDIYLVVWDNHRARFVLEKQEKTKRQFDGRIGAITLPMQDYQVKHFELCGNIHDTPDLLTTKTTNQ